MLTPLEKMGSTKRAASPTMHEAIAANLVHGVAVVAFFLERTHLLRALRALSSSSGRLATVPRRTSPRSSFDLAKFFFWVTTPMLVTVSVMGICQIHVLVMGRKWMKIYP